MEHHLDSGHAERAIGVASAAGGVACGNSVEDDEKDATDAAYEEVMESDEAGALELEDANAMLEGLCIEAEGVFDIAHYEIVTGHVAEFASGTSGTDTVATRGASSAPTATIDPMGSRQFQRHLR